MEKDIGKIKKNEITDIIIRIDDFGGKIGLTIREFSKSDRYTGFTKSGTRIPLESFAEFKELISSIDENEFSSLDKLSKSEDTRKDKPQQKSMEDDDEDSGENSDNSDNSDDESEIQEEVF